MHEHRIYSEKVMAAYVSMINVVNSLKLAYLWSLMSEVKCVMRNQPYTHAHAHRPSTAKKTSRKHQMDTNFSHNIDSLYSTTAA